MNKHRYLNEHPQLSLDRELNLGDLQALDYSASRETIKPRNPDLFYRM